jgi:hypothetical protein
MEDTASLSEVIARAYIIVSLLGPNDMRGPMPYPDYYSSMFPLMREHNVKRILGSTYYIALLQDIPSIQL